jgi:hypothetical protein
MSSLLGPWATAPISEDFTFGVELEFALHGVQTKAGVRFAHSSTASRSGSQDHSNIQSYLRKMGVKEGWR